MGSPRRRLCPSHSCHISFRAIQFLCPIPVSGHRVGWWLPRAGTVGTLHGGLSGQDLVGRAHPTLSEEQGTGAAPAPGIGHLPGDEDSVVMALPAR